MSNVINGKMKNSISNFVHELENKIKDLSPEFDSFEFKILAKY